MENMTPRGLGACQYDPIMQVSHGEANFNFRLCNYITFTPGSFGVQPCTVPWPAGEGVLAKCCEVSHIAAQLFIQLYSIIR